MFGIRKNKEKGKAIIYIADCIGCGECISQCKRDAIGFIELKDGKYAKVMYPERCSGCGKCIDVCDVDAIKMIS